MRIASICFMAMLLAACAPYPHRYYLPIADSGVTIRPASLCGAEDAVYTTPLTEGISMRSHASAYVYSGKTAVRFDFMVEKGKTVRLEKADVRMRTSDQSEYSTLALSNFTIGVVGRDGQPGHLEVFDPLIGVKGGNRNEHVKYRADQFTLEVSFDGTPKQFSVIFPALVTNDARVAPRTLNFVLQEHTAVNAFCM